MGRAARPALLAQTGRGSDLRSCAKAFKGLDRYRENGFEPSARGAQAGSCWRSLGSGH